MAGELTVLTVVALALAYKASEAPGPARLTFWKWGFVVGGVAAVALLIVSLGLLREVRSLESELRASENRSRFLRDRERGLVKRISSYRDALQLLAAPEAREVRFGPQPRQPSGRVFLQPRGLVLVASDFPKPPEGRTYELWLIASTSPAPIPAGVFDPDAQGNVLHTWQQPIQVAAVKALAVSDEPPGGVPVPTGKIHLTIPVQ